MNQHDQPHEFEIPAWYRHIAFFDLLGDAVFQHRHAAESNDSYVSNAFARASVLASALSVECAANCLLATLDLSKSLADEFDKMTPLGKIEAYLRLAGVEQLSRGRVEVAKVVELVKARNEHVHPKAIRMAGRLQSPQDGGTEWLVPMTFQGTNYQNLNIPKQSMLWNASSSLAALEAVAGFYAYLFRDLIKAAEKDIDGMLLSRMEVEGNEMPDIYMPGIADEIMSELRSAGAFGIDFSYFGLFSKSAS